VTLAELGGSDNASVVGTAINGVHVLVDGTAVGTAT